jgi:hypothetical protein
MKHILLSLFITSLFFSSEKTEVYPPVIVLELFTSQGCSSCPPADELLTQIQANDTNSKVIALSYHVDYWNYIGWKDPFSKAEFSKKQRDYGQKFNSSSIYTPQVVINGQEHFVGSNANVMASKLKQYGEISAENKIDISEIKTLEDKITFNYSISGTIKNKVFKVALVIKERVTKIQRGENRNRTLKNSNIVVLEDVMSLKNKSGSQTIIIPEVVNTNDELKIILIIQNSDLKTVGANQVIL